MKPAPSIIGFTAVSGLGYGMILVLAGGALFDVIPAERWLGVAGFAMALSSITVGLLASTFHLGHPERAWLAISQWRSSWLSREGLLALITYVPTGLFAAGWIINEEIAGPFNLAAIGAAIGAAATVYCTGMIYASLPPIKAWHQPLTAPIYLAFALMTGLLAVHLLLALFGLDRLLIGSLTLLAIAGAFVLKVLYWQNTSIEGSSPATTASATGLSTSGLVRMLDPPHTQTNYLLEEMGFQIGRKHARLLRTLTYIFGLCAPVVLVPVSLVLDHWAAALPALLALLSGMIGVLIERWLFFAEAKHTVILYYGGQQGIGELAAASDTPSKPAGKPPPEMPVRRRRATPTRRRRQEQKDVSVDGDRNAEERKAV